MVCESAAAVNLRCGWRGGVGQQKTRVMGGHRRGPVRRTGSLIRKERKGRAGVMLFWVGGFNRARRRLYGGRTAMFCGVGSSLPLEPGRVARGR
jgi:hypothetical protein